MAKCQVCDQEMLLADACSIPRVTIAQQTYIRIVYDVDEAERCHDCNVRPGWAHHAGCEGEQCPRCGGQLFSCDCPGKLFVNVGGAEKGLPE